MQRDLSPVLELMNRFIPFNRYLGLELLEVTAGSARMILHYREELIGNPMVPALHGGVISALIDTCGGAAVFGLLEAADTCSTVDLRIDYLEPGAPEDLVCESRVVRAGNRVVVVDSVCTQSKGTPVATGKGVYNVRRRGDKP